MVDVLLQGGLEVGVIFRDRVEVVEVRSGLVVLLQEVLHACRTAVDVLSHVLSHHTPVQSAHFLLFCQYARILH